MQSCFGDCAQVSLLAKGDGCTVYELRNETGEGTITMYDVFPGVTLSYNDFHMRYFDSEFVPDRAMLCIDHCREGRLEYTARCNAYSYVEAGDLKLDRRLTHTGHFELPLSHYHGAMISLDMAVACASLPDEFKGFPVDLTRFLEKYCPDRYPHVLRGQPAIDHIFAELYTVPEAIKRPYFKIKILELLLFLDALSLPEAREEKPYFYKTQVEKVKAIQAFLMEHMDKSYTQQELAKRFDLPQTAMKQCFRSVFGTSIGAWLTQYRMNQAAVWLRQDRKASVAEIAGRVGYDSPSKFAAAFRKTMGIAPLDYRRAIR
ncbi:MAG: AraC family transcriptional regulator [Clostridia bacterium]|nr:AraC family transcriptional regulator [Clostridia bacterium]